MKMKKPEINIVRFAAEDVIATSTDRVPNAVYWTCNDPSHQGAHHYYVRYVEDVAGYNDPERVPNVEGDVYRPVGNGKFEKGVIFVCEADAFTSAPNVGDWYYKPDFMIEEFLPCSAGQ